MTEVTTYLFRRRFQGALFALLAFSSGLAQTTVSLDQNFGGAIAASELAPDWQPPFQVFRWQVDARCYFNASSVDAANDCQEAYRIVPSDNDHNLCFFDFGTTLFFAGYTPEVVYGTQSFITTGELLLSIMMRVTEADLEAFFQDQQPPYSFPLDVRIYGVEAARVDGQFDATATWQRCLELADRVGGSGVKMAEPPGLVELSLPATATEPPAPPRAVATANLVTALANGDYARFDELVGGGVGVNSRDASGMTPLMHAVISGDPYFVDGLIRAGADVSARTSLGYSALHYAVFTSPEIVARLIEAGADLESQDEFGYTPLLRLAGSTRSSPDMLRLLIELGANMTATTFEEASAFALVAQNNPSVANIEALCTGDRGAINAADAAGNTPLSYVLGGLSQEGELMRAPANEGAVDALIRCGADVNVAVADKPMLTVAQENMHLRNSSAYWQINDLTQRPTGLYDMERTDGMAEITPKPRRLVVGEEENFSFMVNGVPVRSVRWSAALGEVQDGLYRATGVGRESITATNREDETQTATLEFEVQEAP